MSKKAIIPIRDEDRVIIKIRMNYSEVAGILNRHGKIFLRGLNRKESSYAHKRLEILCKCKLNVHPAFLAETNEEGYYFERETQ